MKLVIEDRRSVYPSSSSSILCRSRSHQNEKKTEYGPRAREVEKATLTAAVMSTSGGMGKEMDMLVRQIAMKLSV